MTPVCLDQTRNSNLTEALFKLRGNSELLTQSNFPSGTLGLYCKKPSLSLNSNLPGRATLLMIAAPKTESKNFDNPQKFIGLPQSANPGDAISTAPTSADIKARIKNDARLSHIWNIIKTAKCIDPAHDSSHAFRVARWAAHIAAQESQKQHSNHNQICAIASSLLHDLINPPKTCPTRSNASVLSAEHAFRHFQDAGFTKRDAAMMSEAIRTHSLSRGEAPNSLVGKALQDADRLDALGVMGIMRAASTGAQIGSRFYDQDNPWAHNHDCASLDDGKSAASAPAGATIYQSDLRCITERTLKIADSLNTPTGRKLAKPLVQVTGQCLQQIGIEIGTPLPDNLLQRFAGLSL